MANSANPIGKLMSYQQTNREVTTGVFVRLRQTGYAATHDRSVTAKRAYELPLNDTRFSKSYVSSGSRCA
jgi:hypothetical protein